MPLNIDAYPVSTTTTFISPVTRYEICSRIELRQMLYLHHFHSEPVSAVVVVMLPLLSRRLVVPPIPSIRIRLYCSTVRLYPKPYRSRELCPPPVELSYRIAIAVSPPWVDCQMPFTGMASQPCRRSSYPTLITL